MKQSAGYTVIEVMLFLAISLLIFTGAVVAVGGRQAQVQFTQSVNDLESTLKDVINDVSTGFYPNTGTFTCFVNSSGTVSFNTDDGAQGTSNDCVVLGKVVQFEPQDSPSTINVFTVVGKRYSFGSIPTDLNASHPTAVSRFVSGNDEIDITEHIQLRYGLTVTKLAALGPTLHSPDGQYGSIAFLNNLGSPSSSTSGSSNTNFTYVAFTGLNSPESLVIPAIQAMGSGNTTLNFPAGLIICLQEGGGGSRRAGITIGGGGAGPITSVDFDSLNPICTS